MGAVHRRWFLGSAAVGLLAAAGCNLGSLAYFLTPEQRMPAKLAHLASPDKRKAPKVVILTNHALDIDAGLFGADQQVAERLAWHLQQLAASYKDQVEIVPPNKVAEYKNRNPETWKHDLIAVGKHFKATHVAYIDFLELSMRDPLKVNMYQGKCHAEVQLFAVARPDDPPHGESLNYRYPSATGAEIPVEDMHPDQFKRVFVERIAKNLMPFFADHPRPSQYSMDK
ncbi:MAG: hypothetical protein K2W96_27575 [Gemmataceae bacterium]|nr:hypothetical protein [Gemmataceae bacterium]